MHKPLIAQTSEQRLLYQLQAEWRISDTLAREAIAADIIRHPHWNIVVTEDGPQLATSTQQLGNMALLTRQRGNE